MSNLSSKEIILKHLRENRNREIPLSELRREYGLKKSTISNAIKELELKDIIKIERRPLRRGRYTVISLFGDEIEERYVHPKEPEGVKSQPPQSPELPILDQEIEGEEIEEIIEYLQSLEYNQSFFHDLREKFPNEIELVFNLVIPIMKKTGDLWFQGEMGVATEHLISGRLEQILMRILPENTSGKKKGTILLCLVEGEDHSMSLLLLELILRQSYNIINMRWSMPIGELVDYIEMHKSAIDWIFISISQTIHLGTLKRQVREIQKINGLEAQLAIGGNASSDLVNLPGVNYIMGEQKDLISFLNRLRGD